MMTIYIYRMEHELTNLEYERLERHIPQDKRSGLNRFYHKADACRGLLGEVIKRHAIFLKTEIPYDEQVFSRNAYGKPFLKNNTGIHFNISHSGGYVVCVIDESPIGIDVEEIRGIDLSLADRFFTVNEKRYIHDAPSAQKIHRFFEIWTMKESFIKLQGRGLSIPLNSYDVLTDNGVYFHKVFENDIAVCHICSECAAQPECLSVSICDL